MTSVCCEGVNVSFGSLRALVDVALSLEGPQVAGLVGPNGAGKSTLLDVLSGFRRADRGRIAVGGRSTSGLQAYEVARVGLVRTFQEPRLILQASVLDNILVAIPGQRRERLADALFNGPASKQEAEHRSEALEALAAVGLHGRTERLAGELSYGERKLVTLACAMATRADVVLLDEPLAGVDPDLRPRVLAAVRRMEQADRLVLVIEHDLDAVRRFARRVVVLHQGSVIAQGAPSDVLDQPDVRNAFLG